MDKSFSERGESVARYAIETFRPEDDVLRDIRERSAAAGLPQIHVGRMDGLHLEVLARAAGARKAIEIGTLAGYSGTCIARALGEGGRLHTFEAEPAHAEVARESFRRAGVGERVRIHVGLALERLRDVEGEGPFDLVFIDADKTGYPAYAEWAARNLRVGGLLVGDNTFAWGMIGDARVDDPEDRASVEALRRFNAFCAADGRFRATVLPTGEGLTVAVRIR